LYYLWILPACLGEYAGSELLEELPTVDRNSVVKHYAVGSGIYRGHDSPEGVLLPRFQRKIRHVSRDPPYRGTVRRTIGHRLTVDFEYPVSGLRPVQKRSYRISHCGGCVAPAATQALR
jgi:hypothetical protein